MDSGDFKEDGSTDRRKSLRQSTKTASYSAIDLKARPPIKKTRKLISKRKRAHEDLAVNGSKESKNLEEEDNDESPNKKEKLEKEEIAWDGKEGADGDQADVEMVDDADQDEDINSEEEDEQKHGLGMKSGFSGGSEVKSRIDGKCSADVREENLETTCLGRQSIHKPVDHKLRMGQTANYSTKPEPSSLGAGPVKFKTLENQDGLKSNRKYQAHTEEKARTLQTFYQSRPPELQNINANHTNNFLIRQRAAQHKTPEMKNLKKTVTSRASPASSSRGCTWYMWKVLQWSLMLIGLLALGLLSHSLLPRTDTVPPYKMENFDAEIAALQLLYPSQRSVFWTRSVKHLKRHLQTAQPTEPVSLILTAGLKAERTLACLVRSLAAAYSASLNASVFEINGTTKTAQDSDEVKLEIDTALKEAFEGNTSAAVVHRFEELPSGSTLIFYRYCDHENAAYKKVFLAFTVMLSVDKIELSTSLSSVEDMVHDRIKEKFVSSEKSAVFNQMDVDKLSGLWSRISHLILPVAVEEKVEQQGCGPD